MRKIIVLNVLALLLAAVTVWAATIDFVANANITVSNVSSVGDLIIKDGSKAASWTYNSGTFTVTDPDATAGFTILSSDTDVKAFQILNNTTGAGLSCTLNAAPGTTEKALPTTAGTYKVAASTVANCTDLCTTVNGAATYNDYPTCGAATCNAGFRLSGSGADGVCLVTGGGGVSGGGGGGYSTPSPSPSVSPAASASPSPTPTPTVSGIKEGDLIKTADSPKVYIVKGSFIRWIQNPKIFNLYGHFKWNAIKTISSTDLAKYTGAWLVRASGNPKVYEINGDGSKHWLNMTAAAFTKSGRDWNMVYIINNAELKLYTTGVDVMK